MRSVVLLLLFFSASQSLPSPVSEQELEARKVFCSVCKALIGFLEDTISDEITDIDQLADKACDAVTFGISWLDDVCKKWIDDEVKTVLDDIKKHEPPNKVCEKIRLC